MGFNKVLIFSADWCQWCQEIKPEIARNKEQKKDLSFVELDLTLPFNKEMYKQKYNLRCIPSAILMLGDQEVDRWDADQDISFTDFLNKPRP